MDEPVKPNSWDELNEWLWQSSRDLRTKKYRPYIAFRGVSEDYRDKDLRTGIQRIGDPGRPLHPAELAWRERRLIDVFRLYGQEHLSFGTSDWDVLLLAQHYRLPSRLLDWTSSPYVALFFATENSEKFNRDGIVWCVKRVEANNYLPYRFKKLRDEQRTNLFSVEVLRQRFRGLEDFDKERSTALIWFEPPSIDPRIVNQYALFSVMPGVASSQLEWFKGHSGLCWRVKVPKKLKREVRERLSVMNITERLVYPGLEGIAKWAKAYYGGRARLRPRPVPNTRLSVP